MFQRFFLFLFSSSALVLVACAPASQNSGITSTADIGTTSSINYAPNGICAILPTYNGTDPATAATLANITVCPGADNATVELQLPASFPLGADYCIFPSNSFDYYAPTCLTISGDSSITLSSDQFNSLTIVRAQDESALEAYLAGSSASYPGLAKGQIR